MNTNSNFVYTSKKETCPLCKGNKTVKTGSRMVFTFGNKEPSQEVKDMAEAFANDNSCPHCSGVGVISVPPYNDGCKAKLSEEKMKELASAATLLRCIGDVVMIQAVANEAARISLPDDIVATYVGYWSDPDRDVTLGEYIYQIAETAEELAMKIYGDLGNPIYAGPRPDVKPN